MASGMEWSERGKMEKDVDLSLVQGNDWDIWIWDILEIEFFFRIEFFLKKEETKLKFEISSVELNFFLVKRKTLS